MADAGINYAAATKHIAVLAFPFGTHAAPLLNLVQGLSASVPNLVFFFFSTEESNRKSFPEQLQNINPRNVFDGLPEGHVAKSHHEAMFGFIRAMPGNIRNAMDAAVAETGRPLDGLITDAFFWFAADWAEEMRVPWVAFWTSGPRPLFAHCDTDNLRQQLGINGSPEQTLDFLPDFNGILAGDLPGGVVTGDVDSPFSTMLHKMGLALPRATVIVANSYDDLDSNIVTVLKSKFQSFLNIGPFILTSPPPTSDSHGCLKWLENDANKPASVAYISFGSFITPPPHELAELAAALEETGTPFLWSFRGDPEKGLPEGFASRTSERGKIVNWAPQLEILKHPNVGVFVTHCGWNSVLESVVGGVPMICRSFIGDQQLNLKTVEAVWKMGVGIEGGGFTREGTKKALSLVLGSEEGKRMRERVEVQKRLAFEAVGEAGSSTRNFKDLLEIISK